MIDILMHVSDCTCAGWQSVRSALIEVIFSNKFIESMSYGLFLFLLWMTCTLVVAEEKVPNRKGSKQQKPNVGYRLGKRKALFEKRKR